MNSKIDWDELYHQYAQKQYIDKDPIQIPHRFSQLQDIEIAGFFAAIFSWGRRDIIISKSKQLIDLMGNTPHEFVMNYNPNDFKHIESFVHRTFNATDLDFYIRALQKHYQKNTSLEIAFQGDFKAESIESHLIYFYKYISELVEREKRSLKHISTPLSKSACKRLAMYLRWMVRSDAVDLGLWKTIRPSQLVIPLDVHVHRVATQLNFIEDTDLPSWQSAKNITNKLKEINPLDPVKYDLVLFSLGNEKTR